MNKESSVWFAMLVIMDQLEDTKKNIEHSNNPEEIEILKHYEYRLREHLGNLEDVRRTVVREEENESRNKNKDK